MDAGASGAWVVDVELVVSTVSVLEEVVDGSAEPSESPHAVTDNNSTPAAAELANRTLTSTLPSCWRNDSRAAPARDDPHLRGPSKNTPNHQMASLEQASGAAYRYLPELWVSAT
ncbi:MAG: hypothetical protein ACJAY5_000614 [Actinomycetes bacterium]